LTPNMFELIDANNLTEGFGRPLGGHLGEAEG
jgi:hypothetical protein